MKAGLHSILLQPLLTEKITAMRESNNTVGFLVHPDANRVQIKRAVEALLEGEGRASERDECSREGEALGAFLW